MTGKNYCYGSTESQECHCDYCLCATSFGREGWDLFVKVSVLSPAFQDIITTIKHLLTMSTNTDRDPCYL